MQRMKWAIAGTSLLLSMAIGSGSTAPSSNVAIAQPLNSVTMLAQQAPETIELDSGLQYVDLEVGKGAIAQSGQIALVHYTGTLEDGTVFDSSWSRNWPFDFPLGEGRVIRGWDEGVQGMRVGGRRRLTIPADLAYGNQEVGPIPPNSTLIFEVELVGLARSER